MIFDKIVSRKANIIFLIFGTLAMSQAGIFIKLCNSSIYGIAFFRLLFASIILFLLAPQSILKSIKNISAKDFLWFAIGGFFLGRYIR